MMALTIAAMALTKSTAVRTLRKRLSPRKSLYSYSSTSKSTHTHVSREMKRAALTTEKCILLTYECDGESDCRTSKHLVEDETHCGKRYKT